MTGHQATGRLPHQDVRTRLAPSPIAGIGVFAQQFIGAGTELFPNDQREIFWVKAEDLEQAALQDWQRAFYDDFAIRRGDLLGCPESFDLLSPGWYLNQPAAGQQANVRSTADYRMIAARDIQPGEELTVEYASFSDKPR